MAVDLPILVLDLPGQRYSCHGCGACCRDFTVQLRDDDVARLARQRWRDLFGHEVWTEFRGHRFLRQRADGSCLFLLDDGKCRIHAEYGLQEKPVACRSFPLSVMPTPDGPQMGLNFACGSVQASQGASLASHAKDLRRIGEDAPETLAEARPVALLPGREASPLELRAFAGALDQWMADGERSLAVRVDGLAWLAQSLRNATLAKVRDERFIELIMTLLLHLEAELDARSIAPATERQARMLRQAVFMRTEDPKVDSMRAAGRVRTVWRQWTRQRRFMKGVGAVPAIAGFSKATGFSSVDSVPHPWLARDEQSGGSSADVPTSECGPEHTARELHTASIPVAADSLPALHTVSAPVTSDTRCASPVPGVKHASRAHCGECTFAADSDQSADERAAIDDLVSRWVRARLRGGRAWGAGYYGFSAVEGIAALCVDVASAAWLARLRAASRGATACSLSDVRAAVARVDRTAGRAPWLATAGERLRLSYLSLDDGLRRVCALDSHEAL